MRDAIVRVQPDGAPGGTWSWNGSHTLMSPLDHYEHRFAVPFFFLYRARLDVERIAAALSRVLGILPLLGARAMPDGARYRFMPDERGVPLHVCHVDADMSELFAGGLPKKGLNRFADWNLPPMRGLPQQPLLKLRLNLLRDGTSVLWAALQHSCLDGLAFFDFMRAWAAFSREEDDAAIIAQLATHRRSSPLHAATAGEYDEERCPDGWQVLGHLANLRLVARVLTYAPRADGCIWVFERERLAELKQGGASSNSIVSALLWQLYAHLAEGPSDRTSELFFPANVRQLLSDAADGGNGAHFAGNGVAHVTVRRTIGELLRMPVTELAASIQERTRATLSPDGVRRQYSFLAREERRGTMERVWASPEHFGPDVFLSNFSTFPAYDTDFGWGPPALVTMPELGLPRMAHILPAPDHSGALHVHVNDTREQLAKAARHWQTTLGLPPSDRRFGFEP
jgi:hypothetical protein